MPTRLLREGILDSDRVNSLDWSGEVFYRRLMSKVDDHGLYDARPSMLRASLYPIRTDRVREADISRWLAACEKAGLILLYEADGKQYLRMLDTRWQARAEPKYPIPTANSCKHVKTPVYLDVVEVVVEDEDVGTPVAESADAPPAGDVAKGAKKNGRKALSDGPVVIAIPLVGNAEYEVHQSFVDELERLYPAVDVQQTLREIRGWNLSRPSQRKTAGGVLRHINTWMAKEQNKG